MSSNPFLANATHVGWINDPSTRGTHQVIIGCLFTILVCAWSVLYLNVPAPGDGFGTNDLRKLKWMMITVLLPEFILTASWVERLAAQKLMASLRVLEELKELEGILEPSEKTSDPSTTPPLLWTVEKPSPGWIAALLYD